MKLWKILDVFDIDVVGAHLNGSAAWTTTIWCGLPLGETQNAS